MRQNAILDPLFQGTERPKFNFSPIGENWQEGCSRCVRNPILGVVSPDLVGELDGRLSLNKTVKFESP